MDTIVWLLGASMLMAAIISFDIWSKDVNPYEWFQIWPMTSTRPSGVHWHAIRYYRSLSMTVGRRRVGPPVLRISASAIPNDSLKFKISFRLRNGGRYA